MGLEWMGGVGSPSVGLKTWKALSPGRLEKDLCLVVQLLLWGLGGCISVLLGLVFSLPPLDFCRPLLEYLLACPFFVDAVW